MEQKPQKDPPLVQPFDSIEGTLERFTFRNAETGFAVVRFAPDGTGGSVTAVGQLSQLAEGQRLRIRGQRIDQAVAVDVTVARAATLAADAIVLVDALTIDAEVIGAQIAVDAFTAIVTFTFVAAAQYCDTSVIGAEIVPHDVAA